MGVKGKNPSMKNKLFFSRIFLDTFAVKFLLFQAQNFLIAIIIAAIFDFIIGTIIGPWNTSQRAQGFAGFSSKLDSAPLSLLHARDKKLSRT